MGFCNGSDLRISSTNHDLTNRGAVELILVNCFLHLLYTVHETSADVTVSIREVTVYVKDDFCNILVLHYYTLVLSFMVFWCVSCLIYFIIWDFVFEFYIEYMYFLWSLWRCVHTKRLQWSVSQYRKKVLASLPFLKPILAVLHKILLVFSVSGLVQFLPQQNLVVYYNTLPSLLHTATTYENPEKSGQNKSNDAGAAPPETSHCTL